MRHLEAGLVDALVPVEQQVEVDRSGAARRPSPDASELGFDREEPVEQAARRERRFECDGAVEEARLVRNRADRIGLTQGRNGHHLDTGSRCEALDGNA